MPGVKITTSVRSGPTAAAGVDDATFLIAGQTERGPLTASLVYSLADYTAAYGDRVAYGAVYDQVRTFFEEGGYRVGVSRVVGPAATVGTLTLKDRAGAGGVNTLRVDALNPGAWSTRVTVQVADGQLANTFTLSVLYDGVVQEQYLNLATPAAAALALSASRYVKVTDLGSATAAPNNNPVVLAATVLSAGNDDRASILAAHYVAALEDFDDDAYGPGLVAIPGQPSSAVGSGILAHCVAHNRVGLTAVAIGTDVAGAKTAMNALQLANATGLEYVGMVYPGVVIPDSGGVTRTITPEGFAAAMRSRAIVTEGVWRAPMGSAIAGAIFAVGQEISIDQATGDGLDAANISALRQIAGTTTLYGWRSASLDAINYRLLKARDLLNVIEISAKALMQAYVGQTVDAARRVLSRLQGDLTGLLVPIAAAGGIYAGDNDPGYSVDTSVAAGNTTVNLAAGQIAAVMGVRPAPTAEIIKLAVIQVGLTSNV